jgi:hypothetical protein
MSSVLWNPELKDDEIHFEDKRHDFTKSILDAGDEEAHAELIGEEEKERLHTLTDSLKESERAAFHLASMMSYRPVEAAPRIIKEQPLDYNEKTHSQILLIQNNNAAHDRLVNLYNTRYQ